MSLQATCATLVELNNEGMVTSEQIIAIELVQRGDILKVTLSRIPSLIAFFSNGIIYSVNVNHSLKSIINIIF